MHVFHLLGAKHGLENVRKRRMKVATFGDLNDPFDFFAADLGDHETRRRLTLARLSVGDRLGLLCFSERWDNPVLWSHYAEKHCGICLGFDVADDAIARVEYANRRFKVRADPIKSTGAPGQESVRKLMLTKYSHWRYEREWRRFVPLHECERENGLFFTPFAGHMKLETVIVGALSPVSREEVMEALGDLAADVRVSKSRLAFRSFRVVRQRNLKMW